MSGTPAPVLAELPAASAEHRAVADLDRFLEALEPARMAPRLAPALGVGPASCHVLDAKYEPGVRAILLYEYGGRLLRGDLVDARDAPSEAADGGMVVAPGVRVSVFPDDPELPTLPQVMDAGRLGPALVEALGPPTCPSRGSSGCRTTLLRYRPGKRATVLARLAGGRRLVAKVYHDPAKATAVAEESRALTSAAVATRCLRLAPVVGHLPELRTVVHREVSGLPLPVIAGALPGRSTATGALRQAAEALAELHELPPATERRRSVDRELQRFGQRAARIRTVAPQLGEDLGRLAARLEDGRSHLPPPRLGLVHGDCKPSQFLIAGPQVYLMDLDHLGVSDQATDPGTFLASLRQMVVRRSTSEPSAERDIQRLHDLFLQAYCGLRGDHDRLRIRWHEAVALERKALRAFARAPRSPLAGVLTSAAQRCLDEVLEEM